MAVYVKSGLSLTVLNALTIPHSFQFIALKMYFPCNIAIMLWVYIDHPQLSPVQLII